MDFGLTDEQRAICEEVRRFAENEIAPVAAEHDRDETYPHEVMEKSVEMGLPGAHLPVEYGGAGYSSVEMALIVEELFAVDPGIAFCITAAAVGAAAITEFGPADQKERYLPPITAGESVMGAAISEPGAGSDVTAIETRAEKDGDEWVINGNKMWISNGSVGDYFIVMCETDPDVEDRYSGFSQIIVESNRDGFTAEKITGKLGIRASDTAELVLDDVRVPEENLVGTRGFGFLQLMRFFDVTRTMVAAQGVGIAKGAAERSLEYTQEREQFSKSISEFQAVQHKLADMDTKTEAARLLTHRAADRRMRGERYVKAAAQAKLYASEVSREVANEGIQIHGGYGYTTEFPAERFYRDAKLNEIYEGTSEVLRNTIADQLLV